MSDTGREFYLQRLSQGEVCSRAGRWRERSPVTLAWHLPSLLWLSHLGNVHSTGHLLFLSQAQGSSGPKSVCRRRGNILKIQFPNLLIHFSKGFQNFFKASKLLFLHIKKITMTCRFQVNPKRVREAGDC